MRIAIRIACLSLFLILSISAVFPMETNQPQVSDNRPLQITGAKLGSRTVPRYGLEEIRLDLSAQKA